MLSFSWCFVLFWWVFLLGLVLWWRNFRWRVFWYWGGRWFWCVWWWVSFRCWWIGLWRCCVWLWFLLLFLFFVCSDGCWIGWECCLVVCWVYIVVMCCGLLRLVLFLSGWFVDVWRNSLLVCVWCGCWWDRWVFFGLIIWLLFGWNLGLIYGLGCCVCWWWLYWWNGLGYVCLVYWLFSGCVWKLGWKWFFLVFGEGVIGNWESWKSWVFGLCG